MADSAFTVRVEGLDDLKRALRQLKDSDLNKRVREVNKAAAEIVKPEARKTAPSGHRSRKDSKKYKPGKLEKSITVLASANSAVIKAGSASRCRTPGQFTSDSRSGTSERTGSYTGNGANLRRGVGDVRTRDHRRDPREA